MVHFPNSPIPAPPKLKTTIIQLNKDVDPEDNNYEVLSNEYSSDTSKSTSLCISNSSNEEPTKKRRRCSSSRIGEEELVKRKTETKQLHSLIEKRRRIKINREFEALKYLIPACRAADTSSRRQMAVNSANKIDGMYKLTILKTSVEYILYLHHVINKQHEMLSSQNGDFSFDISFAKVPLDVNHYRNIDQEFDFHELAAHSVPKDKALAGNAFARQEANSTSRSIIETEESVEGDSPNSATSRASTCILSNDQLLTPHITPEFSPVLSMLSRHKAGDQSLPPIHLPSNSAFDEPVGRTASNLQGFPVPNSQCGQGNRNFSFASSRCYSEAESTSTSPFTIPLKTSVKNTAFALPNPALESSNESLDSLAQETLHTSNHTIGDRTYPRKMFFKTKVPPSNRIAKLGLEESDMADANSVDNTLENASKTLLALRKPSIERLLN
ncbi:hypothetical protein OXX80_002801 [Metschnikowia pulcherrima]